MKAIKKILNNQKIRAKGRWRFVFEIGFLGWGIPVTSLQTVLIYFYLSGYTFQQIDFFTLQNLCLITLVLCFEGFTFGLVVWHWGDLEVQNQSQI